MNNRSSNLTKAWKSGTSDLWKWIKGIWSSFSRFVKRRNAFLWKSLHPNQGRRTSTSNSLSELARICPLVGISQFRHAESLTVGDLMAKVKWQSAPLPKAPVSPSATSTSVASIKDEINWD